MTGAQGRPDIPDGGPDRPDARGGIVRTFPDVGETIDCGPLPTSADTVRTPTPDGPDDRPDGVRIAYVTKVPSHLLGVAIADAFATIDAARAAAADPEPTDRQEPPP